MCLGCVLVRGQLERTEMCCVRAATTKLSKHGTSPGFQYVRIQSTNMRSGLGFLYVRVLCRLCDQVDRSHSTRKNSFDLGGDCMPHQHRSYELIISDEIKLTTRMMRNHTPWMPNLPNTHIFKINNCNNILRLGAT